MNVTFMHRQTIYWILGIIFLITAVQALTEGPMPKLPIPESVADCTGEAIVVDYPYEGGFLEPWECQIQCADQKQRYILYTNGIATPCSKLPGCLDEGEDSGKMCTPPPVSPA